MHAPQVAGPRLHSEQAACHGGCRGPQDPCHMSFLLPHDPSLLAATTLLIQLHLQKECKQAYK